MIKTLLSLGLASALAFPTVAMDVEYSSFYSHVKKLNDEDTDALQFAFGFLHVGTKKLCQIESAYIHTQKKDLPIEVTSEHRFTVPSEKALKLAKALVKLEVLEPENHCDMSVQLETKPKYVKQSYDAQELKLLLEQYQNFFSQMGSFLSFLMPTAEGLMLQFPEGTIQPEINANGNDLPALKDNKLTLSEDWINQFQGTLTLSSAPLRITALVPR